MTIAGIRRGNRFSPNHIGNDAAIFSLTAEHLRESGCQVNEYIESDLLLHDLKEKAIFNMVRGWKSIYKLQELEDQGHIVINSGYGIENCTREKMTRLLLDHHIPHPNREEAKCILKEYAIRGIPSVVINEHLVGDLEKFYGVTGTDFFYWFYPSNRHYSKFGLETINGTAHGIPFSQDDMQQICNEAARVLNVHIYGGDCIISEEGEIHIIDFNDWPSFAPCREEAAHYIARRIYELITK